MAKVWQEFYCTKSGDGCGKYFMVKLNMGLNHIAKIICPNCGHEHSRSICNGEIREDGRFSNKVVEEIYPPKSAVTDKPRTKTMKVNANTSKERDGAIVNSRSDFLAASWAEKFGDRVFGIQKEK